MEHVAIPGATGPGSASLVVIPRAPGPTRPADRERHEQDELDRAIDEMFGPTTEDGPGRFDVILFGGGAVLLAWALVSGSSGAIPWAIAAIVLGSVLPVRSLLRRVRARWAGRRLRAAARDGYLLDASSPEVRQLVEAYDRCLRLAARSPLAADIAVAAHQAMVEVATLLDGGGLDTDQELTYVRRRVTALDQLAARLAATSDASSGVADERLAAAARAQAIAELEDESTSSIGQLRDLAGLVTPPRRRSWRAARSVVRQRSSSGPATSGDGSSTDAVPDSRSTGTHSERTEP